MKADQISKNIRSSNSIVSRTAPTLSFLALSLALVVGACGSAGHQSTTARPAAKAPAARLSPSQFRQQADAACHAGNTSLASLPGKDYPLPVVLAKALAYRAQTLRALVALAPPDRVRADAHGLIDELASRQRLTRYLLQAARAGPITGDMLEPINRVVARALRFAKNLGLHECPTF